MFGTERLVAKFVAEGSLVLAVRPQFAEVGSAKSVRKVDTSIKPGREVPDGSERTRQSTEVAREVGKAQYTVVFKGIAVQVAQVVAKSAADDEMFKTACQRGEGSDIKQAVCWNKVFVARFSECCHMPERPVANFQSSSAAER